MKQPLSTLLLRAAARFGVCTIVIAMLGACAVDNSQYREAVAANLAEYRRVAQERLDQSMSNRSLTCDTKEKCNKAFSLAKVYLHDNSDMRVQVSDDTIVSTFGPSDIGNVALTIKRIPDKGNVSFIEIEASCRGMFDNYFEVCANRISRIYNGFKPFVESRLD